MLLSLLLSPLVSMILIFCAAKTAKEIIYTALYFSILSLIQILVIFYYFNPNSSFLQFFIISPFYSDYNSFILGIDSISLWLLWLVNMLMPIVILSSYKTISSNRISTFILLLLFIGFWSNAVFMVLDLLYFYISFEGVYAFLYSFFYVKFSYMLKFHSFIFAIP